MPNPTRFLSSTGNSTATVPSPSPLTVDSDVVIILAALLCALICVIGLAVVVRCAWLRGVSGGSIILTIKSQANKGLKKKVIRSLPKQIFNKGDDQKLVDCAICLTEFGSGDEIRKLPQCGHGFHVVCIDTWFGSHSSCPSCRRILVVPRCQKCGGCPESSNVGGDTETGAKSREDNADRFLP